VAPGEHLHGTSPRVVGHYAIVIVKIASEPALGPEAVREEVLSVTRGKARKTITTSGKSVRTRLPAGESWIRTLVPPPLGGPALLARTAGAEGSGAPPWQESFTARLGAPALLQTLNAELLSHDSATLTLDRWCAAHRLTSPAHIVAERVDGASQAPTDEQRQLLGVSATESIRYRRVRLICGDHVLSEADTGTNPLG